ncbi:MAG: RNA-binding S4 domain-containing protein [Pseudomonadota bacterium]|nr:RNA-binding S4 domain-containing protein [Pseudomonadota bacterium]
MTEQNYQRLDKWLWCGRFFKSRSLATKLLGSGKLRLSGKVITKSNQLVRPNDILTFPQGHLIRVIKVLFLAERRGPAKEAELLFEDLSPVTNQLNKEKTSRGFKANATSREPGAGRPTKSDRRAIDKLMGRN